jgi:hypothetical protein
MKISTDRKRSSYTEKNCFKKSHNYCSRGDSTTQHSSWRRCFHKNSDTSFTNPTSTIGLQLPSLWLLNVIHRYVNEYLTTIKSGHQTTGNVCMIWSDESSFTMCSTSGRLCIWRTPNEAYIPKCLVPTVKHGRGSMMVWAAISWYSILLVPLLSFMANLLQWSTWTGWVIRCNPWSRHLFPNNAIFQDYKCPHSNSWNCSIMVLWT